MCRHHGGPWLRAGVVLALLVVLAPAFGWAADRVGYAEPLENAAEATGAADDASAVHTGLLPEYGLPGVDGATGTLVAAAVGTAVTLVTATALGRLLGRDDGSA